MKKYNISANLIRVIKNLYCKATSAVLFNSSISPINIIVTVLLINVIIMVHPVIIIVHSIDIIVIVHPVNVIMIVPPAIIIVHPINIIILVMEISEVCIYSGVTGDVIIDDNGDRDTNFAILDMNVDTGEFEVSCQRLDGSGASGVFFLLD